MMTFGKIILTPLNDRHSYIEMTLPYGLVIYSYIFRGPKSKYDLE